MFEYTGSLFCKVFRRVNILQTNMASFTTLAHLKPRVAVVQMSATPDKEVTFAQLSALVERAKMHGAQVVFVPECADYVSENRVQAVALAEPLDGQLVGRYKDLAKSLSLWLSIGGVHEKPSEELEAERIYNTHIIIDSDGTIQGIYRKVHLFDVEVPGGVRAIESSYTLPGMKIGPPVASPCGKIGMAICYDMRFPELAVSLAQQGADILAYPSAFMVPTGMAHWDVLLRSRAIENQCYVIAAAQVGQHHAKRSSYGNAMIVDPWGTVIARCHDTIDVCVAEIDLELMAKRRSEMPINNHKRHDLYGMAWQNVVLPIDSLKIYQFGQFTVKGSSVFFSTALSFAFVNRKPIVPGHVLISPLRVVERLSELTPSETADLFLTVKTVSEAVTKRYAATSLTVSLQDGAEAGQTVRHVHVHVLPRKSGDFAQNDDIYKELEEHDKNVKANDWRTDMEMNADAETMKTYFTMAT